MNTNEHENITYEYVYEYGDDDEDDMFAKDKPIVHIYDFINTLLNCAIKIALFLCKICGMYFVWICLHYFSAQLYIEWCVPPTVQGFVMSPFMVDTPHCHGLRWIVYNAATVINNMWIVLGTWIYSLIWTYN